MTFTLMILAWNHTAFARQCLDSIREQTRQPDEVIFLDNASLDGTYETVQEVLNGTNLDAKLLRNTEPQSISSNLNRLLELSSGDIVCFLSLDDWLAPSFIADKVDVFSGSAGVGVVFSSGWLAYYPSMRLELIDTSRFKKGRLRPAPFESGTFFHVGCCYRREVLLSIGGWDTSLAIEDLDLFLRLAETTFFDFTTPPSVYYRIHDGAASRDYVFMAQGWREYGEKYRNSLFFDTKRWLSEQLRSCAAIAIDAGDLRYGGHLLVESAKLNPGNLATLRTFVYLVRSLFANWLSGKRAGV